VPFRAIAERAKPKPEANWVTAHGEHGYTSELSLQAMLDDDVLLAWAHNGAPLEDQHGFPLRLVVPKRYAWKSAKWIRGVEFTTRNERGFWELRGYHVHADPWREERYSYQESRGSDQEP
jgi:DMSO/TMAO reductase YedYZ molybdopterin-dependent catalytic subunit